MKNILLLTILLSTIACNGSGTSVQIDETTGIVKTFQTVKYYSHETCESVDTETYQRICEPLGIKPLASSWTATSNVTGMDGIILENGNLYRLDAYGGKWSNDNNWVTDTEFSVNMRIDHVDFDSLFDSNGESVNDFSGNVVIKISGTVERLSDGSVKFVETSSHVDVTTMNWQTYQSTTTTVIVAPLTDLEWTLN